MNQKEWIRDQTGKILGSYETMPNGDILVRDQIGKILGRYDKMYNLTRRQDGWIVAKGNAIGMLLR